MEREAGVSEWAVERARLWPFLDETARLVIARALDAAHAKGRVEGIEEVAAYVEEFLPDKYADDISALAQREEAP